MPHHGLNVKPQPFTMGADDAYDVAQKEAKEVAVTNQKEESTTSDTKLPETTTILPNLGVLDEKAGSTNWKANGKQRESKGSDKA